MDLNEKKVSESLEKSFHILMIVTVRTLEALASGNCEKRFREVLDGKSLAFS